jgi:hypothetical protein
VTLTLILFSLLLLAPLVAALRGGLGEYGFALLTLIPAVLGVLAWAGIWEARTALKAGRFPANPLVQPGPRLSAFLIGAHEYVAPILVFLGIIVLVMVVLSIANVVEACQESRRTGSTAPTVTALVCQVAACATALAGGWSPAQPARLVVVGLMAAGAVAATLRITPEPEFPPIRRGPDAETALDPDAAAHPARDPWQTFR